MSHFRSWPRRGRRLAALAVALSFTAACAAPTPPATPTATLATRPTAAPTTAATASAEAIQYGEGLAVSLSAGGFTPAALAVTVHSTVVFTNADDQNHQLVAGDPDAPGAPAAFESEVLAPGDTFQFTFETAGDFPYYCRLHPDQRGLIHVVP